MSIDHLFGQTRREGESPLPSRTAPEGDARDAPIL